MPGWALSRIDVSSVINEFIEWIECFSSRNRVIGSSHDRAVVDIQEYVGANWGETSTMVSDAGRFQKPPIKIYDLRSMGTRRRQNSCPRMPGRGRRWRTNSAILDSLLVSWPAISRKN
jgi:hypothetical protein